VIVFDENEFVAVDTLRTLRTPTMIKTICTTEAAVTVASLSVQ